ncbi:MAG: glycogen synthase [Burkholderiaceae bacterium]
MAGAAVPARPTRILHVAAEAHPLIKTGGLADVAGALPAAQNRLGADARLLLPGYPAVLRELARLGPVEPVGTPFGPVFGAARVALLAGRIPGRRPAGDLPVIAIDAPWCFARDGNPYVDHQGAGWADNAERFALLAWVGARIASGELLPGWVPDVLHAHDWHAALAPFYLSRHPTLRRRTVFTIHNLAFQGLFPMAKAGALGLPVDWLDAEGIEFHGELSFMKAALLCADRITTVSPTYAREIATPAFGYGLDGLIRARASRLRGILNGADTDEWDPSRDPALAAPYAHYSAAAPAGKERCRQALLDEFGLNGRGATNPGDGGRGSASPSDSGGASGDARRRGGPAPAAPLLAVVSRLSEQKGLDLLLSAAPGLLARGVRIVVLGAGDPALEHGFRALAQAAPDQVALATGFDEPLAHRIFAGADAIVVPSRFEPCGLTQLYGLRYGSVPIVRKVGGLADTVFDEREAAATGRQANGFTFDDASPQGLAEAVHRAIDAFASPPRWAALRQAGMRADVSWEAPARAYLSLYDGIHTTTRTPTNGVS